MLSISCWRFQFQQRSFCCLFDNFIAFFFQFSQHLVIQFYQISRVGFILLIFFAVSFFRFFRLFHTYEVIFAQMCKSFNHKTYIKKPCGLLDVNQCVNFCHHPYCIYCTFLLSIVTDLHQFNKQWDTTFDYSLHSVSRVAR